MGVGVTKGLGLESNHLNKFISTNPEGSQSTLCTNFTIDVVNIPYHRNNKALESGVK